MATATERGASCVDVGRVGGVVDASRFKQRLPSGTANVLLIGLLGEYYNLSSDSYEVHWVRLYMLYEIGLLGELYCLSISTLSIQYSTTYTRFCLGLICMI